MTSTGSDIVPFTRSDLRRFAPLALSALVIFAVERGWLGNRVALPAAMIVLAISFALSRQRPDPRTVITALVLTAIPVSLFALPGLLGVPLNRWEIATACVRLLLAWAAMLPYLLSAEPKSGEMPAVSWRQVAAALCATVLIGFAAGVYLRRGIPNVVDENLYLYQARSLAGARLLPVADSLSERFFAIRQTFVHEGVLRGQYPVGFPAVLALLVSAGLEGVAGPIIHAGFLLAMYWLSRVQGLSTRGSLLVVALAGTSYGFMYFSTAYRPHGLTALFAVLAAVCFRLASKRDRAARPMWMAGGFCCGMMFAARPLTGLVMSISLAIWLRPPWKRAAEASAFALLGAALPVALTLAYNLDATGSALTFGYDRAHDKLQSLGMGLRGEVYRAGDGTREHFAQPFGVVEAATRTSRSLGRLFYILWPGALILGVLVATMHRRMRVDWRTPFLFAALPAAHFFYFYEAARLLLALFPFAVLGTVVLAERLWDSGHAGVWKACWASVLLSIAAGAGALVRDSESLETRRAYFRVVEQLRAKQGPLLVLVSDSARVNGPLEELFWYNSHAFPGDVVVGRDLSASRAEILARFPDRQVVLFEAPGFVEANGDWPPPRYRLLEGAAADP